MRLVLGGERVEIGFEGWARGKGGEGRVTDFFAG